MSFFRSKLRPGHPVVSPPQWAPAPEQPHEFGKWNDAPGHEYDTAEDFCNRYPLDPPKLLSSHIIDRIDQVGCRAWGIEVPDTPRFVGGLPGVINVQTQSGCKDVCLLSDLPIMAGLYDIQGKSGVYYEVHIEMMDGIIAIGTACRPYPVWRLPGWNRMSAGFHLDDFRKFFEDPDGGRDYTSSSVISRINSGDTIGCGYAFHTGTLFYTYNGQRLPPAFTGIYLPRHARDVFAAIGVEGICRFQVNFGGDTFRWLEGNEWGWRVEGHVGRLLGGGSYRGDDEEMLPAYQPQV
ncbi:hypothetical protein BYT27DRAFT_7225186 [Phlegmacium glaucopus]|nr:hypothetical protein BYT27DRAFT_7225186 [Phlegmacium glaucopus]